MAKRICQAREPRVKCRQKAGLDYERIVARFNGGQRLDLFETAQAGALVAAEQYDAGRLTEGEYRYQVAQLKSSAMSQFQAREQSAQYAEAASMRARAARDQAITAQQQANKPYQLPMPEPIRPIMGGSSQTTTNCQTYGNSTRCQSY